MEWKGSLLPLFWLFLLIFSIQAILTKLRWIKIPSILSYILLGVVVQEIHLAFHMLRKQQVEIMPVASDVEWINKLFGLAVLKGAISQICNYWIWMIFLSFRRMMLTCFYGLFIPLHTGMCTQS
jgi:hypothetical protein